MENNGRGIFYGVIGVATLVVAIIGATFAYFSATAGSANDAITAGGASVELGWSETGYFQTGLVPVETGYIDTQGNIDMYKKEDGTNDVKASVGAVDTGLASKFANSPDIAATDCIDQANNAVCSMYEFTISNPTGSTAAQTVYATLTPKSNTMENLKFAIFKGSASQVKGSSAGFNVNGEAKSVTTFAKDGVGLVVGATALPKGSTTAIKLGNLTETLDSPTKENGDPSTTYTLILWIEEIGETQDEGGSFAGGITFNTTDGGQGVTGVLAA